MWRLAAPLDAGSTDIYTRLHCKHFSYHPRGPLKHNRVASLWRTGGLRKFCSLVTIKLVWPDSTPFLSPSSTFVWTVSLAHGPITQPQRSVRTWSLYADRTMRRQSWRELDTLDSGYCNRSDWYGRRLVVASVSQATCLNALADLTGELVDLTSGEGAV